MRPRDVAPRRWGPTAKGARAARGVRDRGGGRSGAGDRGPGRSRRGHRVSPFSAAPGPDQGGLAGALDSGDPAFDALPGYFEHRLRPALRTLTGLHGPRRGASRPHVNGFRPHPRRLPSRPKEPVLHKRGNHAPSAGRSLRGGSPGPPIRGRLPRQSRRGRSRRSSFGEHRARQLSTLPEPKG